MRIDQTQPAAVQLSALDHGHDFVVLGDVDVWQRREQREQAIAVAERAEGQFADHHRVRTDPSVFERCDEKRLGDVEVVDPDGKRALSLDEARNAQTFRIERTGLYSVHFANGKDAVIGVNADRLESDLEPMPQDLQQMWAGSNSGDVQSQMVVAGDAKFQHVSLWWWVMLLALLVAVAETALSGSYMATQREDA